MAKSDQTILLQILIQPSMLIRKLALVKVVLVKPCDSAPPPLPAGFEISIL